MLVRHLLHLIESVLLYAMQQRHHNIHCKKYETRNIIAMIVQAVSTADLTPAPLPVKVLMLGLAGIDVAPQRKTASIVASQLCKALVGRVWPGSR